MVSNYSVQIFAELSVLYILRGASYWQLEGSLISRLNVFLLYKLTPSKLFPVRTLSVSMLMLALRARIRGAEKGDLVIRTECLAEFLIHVVEGRDETVVAFGLKSPRS